MKKKYYLRLLYLLFIFILLVSVMHIVPYQKAPDEKMRYQVAYYIYEHGCLPEGGDPEIRNETFGISYAYQPVNAYIVQACIMRIAAGCGASDQYLYLAARFADVLFAAATVLLCFFIGDMLFSGIFVWLFVSLVTLLPEYLFISGCINCDTYAVFCAALVILCLLRCREYHWRVKNCIFLGVSIGLAVLSYYNVYGVLLVSAFYCITAVLCDETIEYKGRFILGRTGIVAAAALVLCGWWYIRNGIIYDGDIIGELALAADAEKYALPAYKPSVHSNPLRDGYSLFYMLFDMEWINITRMSFFAVFANMDLSVHPLIYRLFILVVSFFVVCWIAAFCYKLRRKIPVKKQSVVFYCAMVLICIITVALSVIYSYTYDFQPQGRYLFPMLIPGALLCTEGLYLCYRRISKRLSCLSASLIMAYMAVVSIYSIYRVMLGTFWDQFILLPGLI